MTKHTGLWGRIRKTVHGEARDDAEIAAYLRKQDLCVTIREIIRGDLTICEVVRGLKSQCMDSCIFQGCSDYASDFKVSLVSSGKEGVERFTDKRLLRSFAIFVGSVLVMQNWGDLIAA